MDRWMHARQKLTLVYGESKINSYLIPPNTNFKSDGNFILCCLTVDMVQNKGIHSSISSSKTDNSSTFLCGEHVMMNQHIERLETIHILSQSLAETVDRKISVVHGFIDSSS